jgi:hypothetical protein
MTGRLWPLTQFQPFRLSSGTTTHPIPKEDHSSKFPCRCSGQPVLTTALTARVAGLKGRNLQGITHIELCLERARQSLASSHAQSSTGGNCMSNFTDPDPLEWAR